MRGLPMNVAMRGGSPPAAGHGPPMNHCSPAWLSAGHRFFTAAENCAPDTAVVPDRLGRMMTLAGVADIFQAEFEPTTHAARH